MIIRTKFGVSALLATLYSVVGLANQAQAGLLPVTVGIDTVGDKTTYSYNVNLNSDTSLKKGDYFTIYDFAGYIEGSASAPQGFKFTTDMVGRTPSGTLPVDDPNIPNLTWTFCGCNPLDGPLTVGLFKASSIYSTPVQGVFTANTTRQVDGVTVGTITDTQVPVPAVPEPATWMMIIAGLLPLAGWAGYRRVVA